MKKERGSITIITLTTILFLISFLISTYMIIANKRQAQEEIRRKTELLYESDVENAEEIYNGYFADANTVIPISNVDQLLKIGTNKYITSGDKIYKCTPSANYKLVKSLKFNVKDYLTKYPDSFFEQTYSYTVSTPTSEVIKTKEGTATTYETLTITKSGKYLLEVWGANGGTFNSSYEKGGTGGYSKGTVELDAGETLYLYVGGKGSYGTSTSNTATSGGGFNGGGNAGYRGGAGGGATDIRIGGTTLNHRLIVAGGGRRYFLGSNTI